MSWVITAMIATGDRADRNLLDGDVVTTAETVHFTLVPLPEVLEGQREAATRWENWQSPGQPFTLTPHRVGEVPARASRLAQPARLSNPLLISYRFRTSGRYRLVFTGRAGRPPVERTRPPTLGVTSISDEERGRPLCEPIVSRPVFGVVPLFPPVPDLAMTIEVVLPEDFATRTGRPLSHDRVRPEDRLDERLAPFVVGSGATLREQARERDREDVREARIAEQDRLLSGVRQRIREIREQRLARVSEYNREGRFIFEFDGTDWTNINERVIQHMTIADFQRYLLEFSVAVDVASMLDLTDRRNVLDPYEYPSTPPLTRIVTFRWTANHRSDGRVEFSERAVTSAPTSGLREDQAGAVQQHFDAWVSRHIRRSHFYRGTDWLLMDNLYAGAGRLLLPAGLCPELQGRERLRQRAGEIGLQVAIELISGLDLLIPAPPIIGPLLRATARAVRTVVRRARPAIQALGRIALRGQTDALEFAGRRLMQRQRGRVVPVSVYPRARAAAARPGGSLASGTRARVRPRRRPPPGRPHPSERTLERSSVPRRPGEAALSAPGTRRVAEPPTRPSSAQRLDRARMGSRAAARHLQRVRERRGYEEVLRDIAEHFDNDRQLGETIEGLFRGFGTGGERTARYGIPSLRHLRAIRTFLSNGGEPRALHTIFRRFHTEPVAANLRDLLPVFLNELPRLGLEATRGVSESLRVLGAYSRRRSRGVREFMDLFDSLRNSILEEVLSTVSIVGPRSRSGLRRVLLSSTDELVERYFATLSRDEVGSIAIERHARLQLSEGLRDLRIAPDARLYWEFAIERRGVRRFVDIRVTWGRESFLNHEVKSVTLNSAGDIRGSLTTDINLRQWTFDATLDMRSSFAHTRWTIDYEGMLSLSEVRRRVKQDFLRVFQLPTESGELSARLQGARRLMSSQSPAACDAARRYVDQHFDEIVMIRRLPPRR